LRKRAKKEIDDSITFLSRGSFSLSPGLRSTRAKKTGPPLAALMSFGRSSFKWRGLASASRTHKNR